MRVCFGDFSGRYFRLSLGNLSLGHGRRRFESPSTGAFARRQVMSEISSGVNKRNKDDFITEDFGTKHMEVDET